MQKENKIVAFKHARLNLMYKDLPVDWKKRTDAGLGGRKKVSTLSMRERVSFFFSGLTSSKMLFRQCLTKLQTRACTLLLGSCTTSHMGSVCG